jgi:peroxiredoxin Q/BCP
VGVSRDTVESHRAFAAAQAIKPPLLADPDGTICAILGVLPDPAGNAKRTTFIVDKQGIVRYVFESVKVPGHAAHVLEVVREMNS